MLKLSRRNLLEALTSLPLLAGVAVGARPAAVQAAQVPSPRTLVAFFSRSGNTRVIAGQIRRARAADIFEIAPATLYPEDYEETVRLAQRERDTGFEPPLRETASAMASYDVVFLGFPIWGTTAPPVIRSFLSKHDLAGKTLIPFITHGGYGLGSGLSVVGAHAPEARLIEGFTLEADQERRTLERVTSWLGGLPL
ncbi:MAG: flavodoxin [Microvirga sp.]